MALRHDAGIVAARIACFARDLTREMGEGQLATVGQVELFPNLINVIPNRATFTLDLRNTDGTALRQAIDRCMGYAEQAAAEEGVALTHRVLADFEPVAFDPAIVGRVESIAREHGHRVRRLPSGAATMPRCWRACARQAWCSCPALAACRTTSRNSPMTTISRRAPACCWP